MRKLLLFLAVFGTGLGILLLLSRPRGPREQGGPRSEPPREEQPSVPLPEGEGQEGPVMRARLSGPLALRHFDPDDPEAPYPLYELSAKDVRTLHEELHELSGIEVRMFDARTGELRSTLEAKRGEARFRASLDRSAIRPTGPLELWEVELTMLGGVPAAPLTLRVPRLAVELDERIFRSSDPVRLDGQGLVATSIGLVLDEARERLELTRQGALDLWVDERTRVELYATGPGAIVVTRDPAAPRTEGGELGIEVREGALLVVGGERQLRSESERLVIEGRSVREEGGEERFRPRLATASGNAKLEIHADSFEGEQAVLRFDEQGAPEGATLSGGPRASVWIDAEVPGRDADRRVRLELSGKGPLEVGLEEESSFELVGPGRIDAPELDLEVTAERRIAGRVDAERTRGRVELEGAVVAVLERALFEGPALQLDFVREADGEVVIDAQSPGPSVLRGQDQRGRLVRVESAGASRWVLRQGEVDVPFASEAYVRVEGEDGFEAWAGRLLDFRQGRQSFRAEGGVEYRSPRAVSTAPLVIARGEREVELVGERGNPAVVRIEADPERGLDGGRLVARSIVRSGDRATAQGEVSLQLASREGKHELEAGWLELQSPDPEPAAHPTAPRPFVVRARDVRRAELEGEFGQAQLACSELELKGRILPGRREQGEAPETVLEELDARGLVDVAFRGELDFAGQGERLRWSPESGGRLEGSAAERARAWGRLSAKDLPYRMSAERIDFDGERLGASWPQIVLDETPLAPGARAEDVLIGASAEWMGADREGVSFAGVAHLVGRLATGRDWKLNAGSVHLAFQEEQAVGPAGVLRSMVAWDGFALSVGEDVQAVGELLDADFETMRMEGRPARLSMLGFHWESSLIEYDVAQTLVRAEQGRLTGDAATGLQGWELQYESLQPFETPDSTILVLRNPVFTNELRAEEARAEWALFWVDRDLWRARTAEWLGGRGSEELRSGPIGEESEEIQRKTPNLFGHFDTGRISRLLNEVYVEGNVEYTRDEKRMARMHAVYIDLVDGHGWLQDAEVFLDIQVRGERSTLVARAEWMRHSADGSLHADNALATTCSFAEPHYFVRTRDLRFTPSPEEDVAWKVSMRRNALRFDNGLGLPLPAIQYDADRSGRPIFDRLVFGDSARFGQFVEATVNGSLGGVGEGVAKLAGAKIEDVEGRIKYRASYLGSRGLLLGTGVEARAADRFWTNTYIDAVPDDAEDKGLVRVDPEERPDLRYFLRGRARYMLTGREWLDFALATQSDAGVQAEFFEGDFVRYEERDTFVHWRKADGSSYRSVTARVRLDEFRNYVSELPAAIIYEGAKPIATVYQWPLLYRSNTDVGVLKRDLGTSDVRSPFDPVFEDDLGDVTYLRLGTSHRFEVPIPLRAGAWTLSPFTAFEGALWTEASGEDEWALRADVQTGVEASTTWFRTSSSGRVHSLTPTLGVRTDLASLEDGGEPIPVDELEIPRDGLFFDVGLRSRWWKLDSDSQFSIDLRSTHASDVDEGGRDGWLGLAVLGELATRLWGLPVVANQDGRFDFENGTTPFSRTRLGFSPHQSVGVELAYASGRDEEARAFEAVSAGARWRATGKWEFEGRETWDLQDGAGLDTRILLRRYGHDFIFELEVADRAGEGQSLSIGVKPVLGFRRPQLGLIERWLEE